MDMYTGSSDLDLSLNIGDVPVERSRSESITVLRKLTRALHGLQNGQCSECSECSECPHAVHVTSNTVLSVTSRQFNVAHKRKFS